jgi:hypothetical protein
LKKVIGPDTCQQGSLVDFERLRQVQRHVVYTSNMWVFSQSGGDSLELCCC